MMKKNKLLKSLLLLTVMLVGSITNVWAADVVLLEAQAKVNANSTFTNSTCTTSLAFSNDGAGTVADGWGSPLSTFEGTLKRTASSGSITTGISGTSASQIVIGGVSSGTGNRTLSSVKVGENTLASETDYTVTGSVNGNSSMQRVTVAFTDVVADGSSITFTFNGNVQFYYFEITPGTTAAVTGYSLDGVKINGTVATENTDYTINGTTITLVNSYITAPTVALVEKTEYETGNPTTKDVEVTLGAASEGYFSGSATIGKDNLATTYTVQVPVDATPTLTANTNAVTVTSARMGTGTATIHLTGANLAGEEVSIALASSVDGLSVSPASIAIEDGAVDADVTVSYTSNEDVAEANVNLTISTTGVSNIVIPVTYSSTAAVTTITDVIGSTTWNWDGASSSNIESPDANNIIPFLNADGWNSSFDAASLSGKGQYLSYSGNKCFQGSVLKFHTTVAGKVTVVYSNTGNREDNTENYRYLYINDVKADETGSISAGNTKRTVEDYSVEAGDVVLTGIQGESTPNMLRIYSVVFTPATATVAVTGVTLDETAEVEVGNTVTLTATVAPANATNKNVTWASDDETIATVEDGVVTGVAEGTANITVTTEDGSFTASCAVTVKAATPEETPLVTLPSGTRDGYGCTGSTTTVNRNNAPLDGQTVYELSNGGSMTVTVPAYTRVTKISAIGTGGDNNTSSVTITGANNESANGTFNNRDNAIVTLDFSPTTQTTAYTISVSKKSWIIIKVYGEETNEATVTVSSVGYATFSSSKAFDFSQTDITVYKAQATGTSVTLTEVTDGIVPANTGVVLYAAGGATATVPVTTTESSTTWEDNEMVANVVRAKVAKDGEDGKTNYILSKEDDGVGFYLAASGGAYLPANRAYLSTSATGTGNAPFLGFDGNETTGINSVERGALSVEGCYTLDGRRVAQPTKGLYIVNGKKVLVK